MESNKLIKRIKLAISITIIIIIVLIAIIILYKDNRTNIVMNNNIAENKIIYNQATEVNNINSLIITDNPEDYKSFNKELENSYKILQNVISRKEYVTISSLANRYIYNEKQNNTEILNSILTTSYKKNYATNTKIEEKETREEENYSTIITEMKKAQINDNNYVFIVNGKIRKTNDNSTSNFSVIIQIDTYKNIYSVYPERFIKDNGYDKLNVGDRINFIFEEITENDNNKFTYITKKDSEMAEEYFNNYKELLIYYQKDAYLKLNNKYSNKRFENELNFNKYIKEKNNSILLAKINQYKVNSYSEYTDYICTDQYDNYYIFRQQNGIMNYTVFLDEYTIMLDEDIKYYNELDKINKAKYNLNTFIRMVNTKDYNAIYKVLDNTFKSNNLNTVEKLEQYIKSNMYDVNSIEIDRYDDTTYEYYIFICEITNQKNENETKEMTIIINQSEGTNYTMSFSFEE